MLTNPLQPEEKRWLAPVAGVVLAVTALRLVALMFNRTDLFVDESQYWLWGQNLDFGYYSKPPLIAWVIGAVTDLAGSDAPFWVRMPGAVLHGATALVLAALAKHLYGARAAFWVGASYVTAPFATVGSLLISTDTIMAPAYALALLGWFRLAKTGLRRFAVLAGAAAGLAFLAKYAAVYLVLGAVLAAALVPAMRIGWRNALLAAAVFGGVILPNLLWNLGHDLTTVSHTMDNVGWVRADSPFAAMNPAGLAEFFFSQFAVFGPLLFGALLLGTVAAWRDGARALVLFSLPVLLIVCAQALMAKAYANWAVATYFAGTLIAVPYLLAHAPRLLPASLILNAAVAVLLPLLTITAPWPERGGTPLMKRYLGRADLSRQIVDVARVHGAVAVFAQDRDILADLFYTGAGSGLVFYAPKAAGRPHNYYEQMFALPEAPGRTLYLLAVAPVCHGATLAATVRFDTAGGAYSGREINAYLLPAGCRLDTR